MGAITRRDFVKGAAIAPLTLPAFAHASQSVKSDRFDIVVAGAGHNSLVAAAYLAKAGYRSLVLEGRPIVGGGVKTAELTLRGFNLDGKTMKTVLRSRFSVLSGAVFGLALLTVTASSVHRLLDGLLLASPP